MSPVKLISAANYELTAFRLQLVIHSVLASRILFHLRSSDSHAHETDIPLIVSAPRYGQPSQIQTNEIKDETNGVWGDSELNGLCSELDTIVLSSPLWLWLRMRSIWTILWWCIGRNQSMNRLQLGKLQVIHLSLLGRRRPLALFQRFRSSSSHLRHSFSILFRSLAPNVRPSVRTAIEEPFMRWKLRDGMCVCWCKGGIKPWGVKHER